MAKSDADAEKQEPQQAQGGGMMKMMMMGIGMFALVTVSNVIAPLIAQRVGTAPPPMVPGDAMEAEGESGAMLEAPIYQPLLPAMIVNFSGSSSAFLQVQIEVVARDQAIIEAVKTHDAAIRNALLMLFAGETSASVSSREGKEALRLAVLAEIQAVLEPYVGTPNVDDVFFTSFVAQ